MHPLNSDMRGHENAKSGIGVLKNGTFWYVKMQECGIRARKYKKSYNRVSHRQVKFNFVRG